MVYKSIKFSLVSFLIFLLTSCEAENPQLDEPEEDEPEEVVISLPPGTGIGEARDISSTDLVAEMGVGWNLGNSFDVISRDKTLWGNPLPSKAIIDAVSERGFKTLRIPITWGFHQRADAPYTIEPGYLSQIKQVVDYGFHNRMHVIVNVHHDNEWVRPNAEEAEETLARLSSLWTQVSTYFQAYNDSLIFETLNEPRLEGIPEEWSGRTAEGRAFINDFHKAAVDAIRATGGNNEKRHIMIPTWAASTVPSAMDDLIIPNDDPKIIISLHSYFPWQFAGEASISWGSAQDKTDLEGELDRIRSKWIVEQGRPVILGEWGSIEDNPLGSRIEYAQFYASAAADRDMLTIVWDDGGMFRMLNRNSLTWDYGGIATAIVNASE